MTSTASATPAPLAYGTDGARGCSRRRLIRRCVAMLVLAMGVAAWRYGPRAVACWRRLAVQERLMAGPTPGQVLLTLSDPEAQTLRDGPQPPGGQYVPLFGKKNGLMRGRLRGDADYAGWLPDGYFGYMRDLANVWPEEGPLCTIGLTRPDGQRRLVVLDYDVFGMINCLEMSVQCHVIEPGTLFSAPRGVGGNPTVVFLFKPTPNFARVLAPEIDARDRSSFTMRYETNNFDKQKQGYFFFRGVIRGKLGSDDRLTITRAPAPVAAVLDSKP